MVATETLESQKRRGQAPSGGVCQLSGWILAWFYATAVICVWDATFIMLRPYSLPGGSLATFWYLYKYYVAVDQRYLDTSDGYVFAQSLLNYAEVVFNIIAIVMHYRCSRHTTTTAFMVSVMTMWKTVLYFLMFSEFCQGGTYRQGNTAAQEFFLVVIPNIIWIIVPLCVMYTLWQQLTPASHFKVVASLTHLKTDKESSTDNPVRESQSGSVEGTIIYSSRVNRHVNGNTVALKRNIN